LRRGFEIGVRFVRLAPCAARPRAEVFQDKVDVAVETTAGTIEGARYAYAHSITIDRPEITSWLPY
jgi:hypothetical protein